MNSNIKLKQVTKNDMLFLYDLLKNKDPNANISHKKMPSYDEHIKFVCIKTIYYWYIIEYDEKNVGAIYLSKLDEIGISINNDYEYDQIAKDCVKITYGIKPTKTLSCKCKSKRHKITRIFIKKWIYWFRICL